MTSKKNAAALDGDGGEQENGDKPVNSISPKPPFLEKLSQIEAVRGYLHNIGAEQTSMLRAEIKTWEDGYPKGEVAIRFTPDGEVQAPVGLEPTDEQRDKIREGFKQFRVPASVTVGGIGDLLDTLKMKAADDTLFVFTEKDGRARFVEQRIYKEEGGKECIPWTYYETGKWEKGEPSPVPLYGLDQLKNHATVFLHEGPKAARAMRRMVEARTDEDKAKLAAHPWAANLRGGIHLGWPGGVHAVEKVDWEPLQKAGIRRVYIIPDQDDAGRSAVPNIARKLNCETYTVQFTNAFPPGFDLADDFPADLFEGERYTGPTFRQCLHPATWMTKVIPQEKKKPRIELRDAAKNMFVYVESTKRLHLRDVPQRDYDATGLNAALAQFSHGGNLAQMIVQSKTQTIRAPAYRPDQPPGLITHGQSSALNLYQPPDVRAVEGDPGPWLEFLEYLFPNEGERRQVARWCATLIAQPKTRMHYALLLVSGCQGTGKTTLAWILSKLVGDENTSWPNEHAVVDSGFTGWLAFKRLVVISEIYAGHSWKAYQKLKEVITDAEVHCNRKYEAEFTLENWAHIVACSNSLQCLRIEDQDRRWFYPELVEKAWPRERFVALREWLAGGGFEIVKWWADNFGDYVLPGEHAPASAMKDELIEASVSFGTRMAQQIADAIIETRKPVAVRFDLIEEYIREKGRLKNERIGENARSLRAAMMKRGALSTGYEDRVKSGGQRFHVIYNTAMEQVIKETGQGLGEVNFTDVEGVLNTKPF